MDEINSASMLGYLMGSNVRKASAAMCIIRAHNFYVLLTR